MKRFYCTECRKMKRTQQWPVNVMDRDSVNPSDRIGECNWHAYASHRIQHRKSPKSVVVKSLPTKTASRKRA